MKLIHEGKNHMLRKLSFSSLMLEHRLYNLISEVVIDIFLSVQKLKVNYQIYARFQCTESNLLLLILTLPMIDIAEEIVSYKHHAINSDRIIKVC